MVAVALEADEGRREFLEQRMSGIGSTDAPKILGFSRRGTALTVYRQKIGEDDDSGLSLPAWLGLKLQSTVGELYAAREKVRVRAADKQYRHKQHNWLVCHLDFRVWGDPTVLVEAKTRAFMTGFGEDGTTEVPLDIWVQAQQEMCVTGAVRCDVAVLFGHHTFRIYPLPRNDEFIAMMIPKLSAFWHENVLQRIPPEATGSPMDDRALRRMQPRDDGLMIPATAEQTLLINRYRVAVQQAAEAAAPVAEIENKLIQMIGGNAGFTGTFGEVTFKKARDANKHDWKLIAEVRGQMIDALLEMAAPGEDEVAVQQLAHIQQFAPLVEETYATHEEGSRRFHAKWSKENAA